MPWGIVNPLQARREKKAIELAMQRKLVKSENISRVEAKKAVQRKLYADEYTKQLKKFAKKEAQYKLGLKKRPPIISRQGLKSALSSIGRNIETQKAQFDMARSRTAGTTARSIVEPRRSNMVQNNFFEHKDEIEVYGDEGLTFFDSNKKGNGQRTGELFGF